MAEGQIKAWREFGHDVLMLENGTAASGRGVWRPGGIHEGKRAGLSRSRYQIAG